MYSTAGRMVKTGLTASVIVSQWTWAATLLQSSNVAWKYGVSGPFWWVQLFLFDKTRCHISYVLFIAIWHTSHICALIHCCIFYPPYLRYASGATIQVLLFGVLAISLKDRPLGTHHVWNRPCSLGQGSTHYISILRAHGQYYWLAWWSSHRRGIDRYEVWVGKFSHPLGR